MHAEHKSRMGNTVPIFDVRPHKAILTAASDLYTDVFYIKQPELHSSLFSGT